MEIKTKKITEEELIRLLKEGDKAGMEYLYDNYSNALYGVILRIVNQNEDVAGDVLQESFVKIWKKITSYDSSKGRLFTWLMNICRNSAIDTVRSRQFKKSTQNRSIDSSVHIEDSNSKSTAQADFIGVDKELKKLKPEYQQLIDLVYYKGYTHSEISEEFNIPLGTVKTRIRTALITLRENLA